MSDSYVQLDANGKICAYVGEGATRVVRARVLVSAINLYIETEGRVVPTRGVGIKKMLAMAQEFTGRKYSTSKARQAAEDVSAWANSTMARMPVAPHVPR